MLGYHPFTLLGGTDTVCFEVFEHRPSIPFPGDEEPFEHGFYWRSGFPGSPLSGPAFGPFKSAQEAYDDAVSDL